MTSHPIQLSGSQGSVPAESSIQRHVYSELLHYGKPIPLTPAGGDAAIFDPDDFDPAESDSSSGRRNTHVLTLVSPCGGPADGHLAVLFVDDQILCCGKEVGESLVEVDQTFLETLVIRRLPCGTVVNEVRGMETVDGGDIASLPELHPAVGDVFDVIIRIRVVRRRVHCSLSRTHRVRPSNGERCTWRDTFYRVRMIPKIG